MATDRDDFLIDLYRLFPGAPPGEFSDAALNLLKERIRFESALWGTFALTPEGASQHTVHLQGLPMEMLHGYERVHPHNQSFLLAVARPGRTINLAMERVAAHVDPIALEFGRRWGLTRTLTTVIAEPPLNLFSILAIYRSDSGAPFEEKERRFMQSVVEHLVAAWRMNVLHFLDAPSRPARKQPRARALVTPRGEISVAEPGLAELLRAELPGWRGPRLPEAMSAISSGEAQEYKGRALIASLVRRLEDGTVVVSVRARAPVDELSQKELRVAREFASGKSHKEIAALCGNSPATVRSQLRVVYAKLCVGTKIELLRQLEESS